MPAVTAIEVAVKINLRMRSLPQPENMFASRRSRNRVRIERMLPIYRGDPEQAMNFSGPIRGRPRGGTTDRRRKPLTGVRGHRRKYFVG
jgi:hypothetical protein